MLWQLLPFFSTHSCFCLWMKPEKHGNPKANHVHSCKFLCFCHNWHNRKPLVPPMNKPFLAWIVSYVKHVKPHLDYVNTRIFLFAQLFFKWQCKFNCQHVIFFLPETLVKMLYHQIIIFIQYWLMRTQQKLKTIWTIFSVIHFHILKNRPTFASVLPTSLALRLGSKGSATLTVGPISALVS